MQILPLTSQHLPAAAALFAGDFSRLRRVYPALPDRLEDPACTVQMLANLLEASAGLGAFEEDRLIGYLGWWIVDDFRDMPRRAGYVPEWAHAVDSAGDSARTARIYQALYRAAAGRWFEAGCRTHAITLLGNDRAAQTAWFWNGFGLTVVDGIRPMTPLNLPALPGYHLRLAAEADAALIAELEGEHWQHYGRPPVLMLANWATGAAQCAELIHSGAARFWLAETDATRAAAGYLRFEPAINGGTAVIAGADGLGITGAYVRPAHRGRGITPALLDAALRQYQAEGFQFCSVDFESFNPEAAAFWPRYFDLVTLSLTRVPEKEPV